MDGLEGWILRSDFGMAGLVGSIWRVILSWLNRIALNLTADDQLQDFC